MLRDRTIQLALTVFPANYTDAVLWKSSDPNVATVSETGVVTALNSGSTLIKVMVGSQSATCSVTVVEPVERINLNTSALTLDALDEVQLIAQVYPYYATQSVTWSSTDASVASVSENGLVTAHGKGVATITATAQDGSGISRSCTVTVLNNAYIASNVNELESPHSYESSCNDLWVYTLPGATRLYVTFDARTSLETRFDYLYLLDGSGVEIGRYTGTELAGQTIEIPGDTVRIKLKTDASGSDWGFKVTAITADGASQPVEEPKDSSGDLSGNGTLESDDLLLLSKYLIGFGTLNDEQLSAADLNGDHKITAADAVLLAKMILNG